MATTAVMSGLQFDSLPYEEGRLWELLEGELVPVSSTTPEHQMIMQELLWELMTYFKANPGYGLTLTDVEFALDENSRVRPDVLVLLSERAASLDMRKVPVPDAPDIAVEIISPSERAADTQAKVDAYLSHGTQEVWQVYPRSKTILMRRSGTAVSLKAGESLTSPLLPGFSLNTSRLF